jgi:hypothetical protein
MPKAAARMLNPATVPRAVARRPVDRLFEAMRQLYRDRLETSGVKRLFQLDFAAPAGHGKMLTA